jgi:hypothetical protein
MINDPKHPDETQAPGHRGNAGPADETSSKEGKEEAYQRSRDQAPTGDRDVSYPDSSRGRAASGDRQGRIRQRAYELWEADGRPDGATNRHWSRAAEDLDREDAAIQREAIAGEKPGVRPQGDADFARDKS